MQKGKRDRGQSMMQREPTMSTAQSPPNLSSMDSLWRRETPWCSPHNLPQTSAGSCTLGALAEKNLAQSRDQQWACPSFQPQRTQRKGKASRWCTAFAAWRSYCVISELSCKLGSTTRPWHSAWTLGRRSRVKAKATAQSHSGPGLPLALLKWMELHPLNYTHSSCIGLRPWLNKTLKHMLKFKHMNKQFQANTYILECFAR